MVPFSSAGQISPPAICCATPATLAMIGPANPPTRNFRPLTSSEDLLSFRHQPPISAPPLPLGPRERGEDRARAPAVVLSARGKRRPARRPLAGRPVPRRERLD